MVNLLLIYLRSFWNLNRPMCFSTPSKVQTRTSSLSSSSEWNISPWPPSKSREFTTVVDTYKNVLIVILMYEYKLLTACNGFGKPLFELASLKQDMEKSLFGMHSFDSSQPKRGGTVLVFLFFLFATYTTLLIF